MHKSLDVMLGTASLNFTAFKYICGFEKKKSFGEDCLVSKFQRINVFAKWYNSVVSFITSNGERSFGLTIRRSCEVHSCLLPQQGLLETFSLTDCPYLMSDHRFGVWSYWHLCFNLPAGSFYFSQEETPWGTLSLSWDLNCSIATLHRLAQVIKTLHAYIPLCFLSSFCLAYEGRPLWLFWCDLLSCWNPSPLLQIVCQPFFFLRFAILLFPDLHCT